MSKPMIEGNLYKLTYLQQGGNGRWSRKQMTAVYLGYVKRSRQIVFSLRPLMGSTSLSVDQNPIEQIELVEENIPHKYRNGVRDKAVPVKLPKSLGYVPKPDDR
jgi:hypothetical protein